MLGTISRSEATGYIHNSQLRSYGQGFWHHDLRQWRALLPIDNNQPAAVSHHFEQVQASIQGKNEYF